MFQRLGFPSFTRKDVGETDGSTRTGGGPKQAADEKRTKRHQQQGSGATVSTTTRPNTSNEQCLAENALSLELAEDKAGQMLATVEDESIYGGGRGRTPLELERVDQSFAEWRRTHGDLGAPIVQCIMDKLRAGTRPQQDERKVAARAASAAGPAVPLPRLPVEMLSHAFTFLDRGDVPAVAVACREWNVALDRAEEELWLMLVRRYHPTVEHITRLLATEGVGVGEGAPAVPASQQRATAAGSASATAADATATDAQSLPDPSQNWKHQFQRRHALLRKADADKANVSVPETPPPRPLSAYIAQIDFTCYIDGDDDTPRKKVGIISTVVENLKFNKEKDKVELSLEDLRPSFLRMKKFDSFDIAINLIERSTGRQSLVFNGELDQFMSDEDEFYFGSFEDFDIVPLLRGMPDSSLDSCVWLRRRGCICHCEDLTVFNPSTCRCKRCGRSHCCSCKVQWSCFYRFVLLLEIRLDVEVDFVELGRNYLLTVLQEGLVYS